MADVPDGTKFEFSFLGNDRRPSQKSGTRRENRNAPDSPDLSLSIPDDRGYLRFRVFIGRQNLGQSGNSKIPDRLGFSRHMKTRLWRFYCFPTGCCWLGLSLMKKPVTNGHALVIITAMFVICFLFKFVSSGKVDIRGRILANKGLNQENR